MVKMFSLLLVLFLSHSVRAQDCVNTVVSFRKLLGNSDFALNWKENTDKNPFYLSLKDSPSGLLLNLRSTEGQLAKATVTICSKGEHFVAKVNKVDWSENAPAIARKSSIKELKLKLPYQSLLKVSIPLFSFEFSPSR